MAGRGTDIVLGGNLQAEIDALNNPTSEKIEDLNKDWETRHQKVLSAGGLHIYGTERHESRRIDNQLRGRSGRQGDPGVTRFYLSMDDNDEDLCFRWRSKFYATSWYGKRRSNRT